MKSAGSCLCPLGGVSALARALGMQRIISGGAQKCGMLDRGEEITYLRC